MSQLTMENRNSLRRNIKDYGMKYFLEVEDLTLVDS